MLLRGTSKLTRRQIEDRIAELKAQVRIGQSGGPMMALMTVMRSSPGVLDGSIETTRENLSAVLDLVGEILRDPAFPEDEFEKLQRETLAQIEQQISEPMTLAMVEVQRRLNPYPKTNIRYVPTLAERTEQLRSVTLDQVRAIYEELIGASAADLAVVGDFDPAQVKEQLAKLWGDWQSPKTHQRVVSLYQPIKPDTVVINTPDKASAMFALGVPIEIRDDDSDYPALFFANYLLGGGINSRLMGRIRQKEGLSYSCGSGLGASPHERAGSFLAFGICAPENAEKALACAREEIARLIKDGVPQQELDDARKGYRQQLEVMLANDQMLSMTLANNLYLDRTMKFAQDQLAKIEALTPKDVQGALTKYVRPEQLVVIRAGDFKQPSPKSEG
jgi:zinc protease